MIALKYDKKLAELNLSISLRELSTQHAKELNQLDENLASKNRTPTLRFFYDFLEKKLKENLDVRLKCITDSFYDDVEIDDATEKEIKASLDRYLNNEKSGLSALYSSRIARYGYTGSAKRTATADISTAVAKYRADLFAKLKVAIMEHNKGIKSQPKKSIIRNDLYVAEERINDLKKIESNDFDFTKLIRFCEELNSAHAQGNYLSIIMLVRSILNHVPPVFGETAFKQVASNYKYTGGDAKSFRASMKNMETSSRNIADAHLHLPIRKKESLPTFQQVNFSAELDVLLAEIIRIS